MENATETFLRNCGRYTKQQVDKLMKIEERRDAAVANIVGSLFKKHSLEHIEETWMMSEAFEERLKEVDS
jgi:hypothetical protein